MNAPTFTKRGILLIRVFLIVVFLLSSSVLFASSNGEHDVKGWMSTDTFRVINFMVLAGGLFIVLKKPVAKVLNNRIRGIDEKLRNLELRKEEAHAKLVEYDKKLSKLDEEANLVLQEYIRQGEKARDIILAEAEVVATKLKGRAKAAIEHEFMIASAELQREIVEKALFKAEKLMKNKIDLRDQDKLVDEYLNRVVA